MYDRGIRSSVLSRVCSPTIASRHGCTLWRIVKNLVLARRVAKSVPVKLVDAQLIRTFMRLAAIPNQSLILDTAVTSWNGEVPIGRVCS